MNMLAICINRVAMIWSRDKVRAGAGRSWGGIVSTLLVEAFCFSFRRHYSITPRPSRRFTHCTQYQTTTLCIGALIRGSCFSHQLEPFFNLKGIFYSSISPLE